MKTKSMPAKILLLLIVVLVAIWGTVLAPAQNQSAQRPASGQKLALRGGLLIDGTGAAPINNAVVVVSDGKIQSVGPAGSVAIPPDAMVIDSTGKTMLPGLVDPHI